MQALREHVKSLTCRFGRASGNASEANSFPKPDKYLVLQKQYHKKVFINFFNHKSKRK